MNPPALPKCVEGLGSGGFALTGRERKLNVRKILDTTPYTRLKGVAAQFKKEAKAKLWITISNSYQHAIGFAIIEKE